MADIDERIETAQKRVETAQARLKRLKKEKAQKQLKADYEAVKAENGTLKADLAKWEAIPDKLNALNRQKVNFNDGRSIEMIPADDVQAVLDSLKDDAEKAPIN